VSPFITVSTKPVGVVGGALPDWEVCRTIKVNLNVSSSSLLSLMIKLGAAEGEASGS
jgi:hypothetical protein